VTVKNLAASVHARLQNHARATKRPFQELLQYYAIERFLYRLSKTPHRERFVLKGALMLHVWKAPLARATKDLDFLGRLDNSLENLEGAIRQVCAADVEPDGMVFDAATVKTERIKEDSDYEGVRVRFVGLLGRARVAMQIDVGFGDVVTPGAETITYPALLEFPAPELSGYPRETVVAEKFQAMVYLRTLNSRMKDFYDVRLLASQYAFDGALLAKAIAATFANRDTRHRSGRSRVFGQDDLVGGKTALSCPNQAPPFLRKLVLSTFGRSTRSKLALSSLSPCTAKNAYTESPTTRATSPSPQVAWRTMSPFSSGRKPGRLTRSIFNARPRPAPRLRRSASSSSALRVAGSPLRRAARVAATFSRSRGVDGALRAERWQLSQVPHAGWWV
jgi:hypothetical protein